LGLQLDGCFGCGPGIEPAFEGLVEAFNLALGLRVVGMPVLLGDAQGCDEVFERVAAASEFCGVNPAVIGQG